MQSSSDCVLQRDTTIPIYLFNCAIYCACLSIYPAIYPLLVCYSDASLCTAAGFTINKIATMPKNGSAINHCVDHDRVRSVCDYQSCHHLEPHAYLEGSIVVGVKAHWQRV